MGEHRRTNAGIYRAYGPLRLRRKSAIRNHYYADFAGGGGYKGTLVLVRFAPTALFQGEKSEPTWRQSTHGLTPMPDTLSVLEVCNIS